MYNIQTKFILKKKVYLIKFVQNKKKLGIKKKTKIFVSYIDHIMQVTM